MLQVTGPLFLLPWILPRDNADMSSRGWTRESPPLLESENTAAQLTSGLLERASANNEVLSGGLRKVRSSC